MGGVSVQVTKPRRRSVRRPGPSQIKMMYGFCRLFFYFAQCVHFLFRPSAVADSEERLNLYDVLIRRERWIVLMTSPIVRDVRRQRCWKRGSGDGQRLLVFGTTVRLSDLSMPLKGKLPRSPEQSAWGSIARSGKFVRRAYRGERLIVKGRRSYAFSHRGAHFCLRGVGKAELRSSSACAARDLKSRRSKTEEEGKMSEKDTKSRLFFTLEQKALIFLHS